MKNELLEKRINIKLNELKALKDMYLTYLLKDDKDKYASEQLNIINKEIRILEEILKGE